METVEDEGYKSIYQVYVKQDSADATVLITDELEFGVKL